MSFEGISIIIPSYNDNAGTRMCLDAINAATLALTPEEKGMLEVIVVDDASFKAFAYKDSGIAFMCHRHEVNKGVGAARNAGARLAAHNYLLFVDSDVQMAADFLSIAFDRLRQSPVRVLQGICSARPANENPGLFHHYLAISWHYFHQWYGRDFLSTLCMIINRSFFFQVGGFLEDFSGSGGEEFDLTARVIGTDRHAIVSDQGLMFFHRYAGFGERVHKLLIRSPRLRTTFLNHATWPVQFQREAGIRAFFAVCLTLMMVLLPFSPLAAFGGYCIFACLLYVADIRLSMSFYRRHSWRLAMASVFFRQVEYMIVLWGLLWGIRKK